MARMIANRAFRYASRELSADEEFEADSKDVRVLTMANPPLARHAGGERRSAESTPAAWPKSSSPRGGRYNRRDMRAKE